MNSVWILNLLSNPALMMGIITILTGGLGTLGIRACSQSDEISQLKSQLTETKLSLSRCEVNLGIIQADINRQALELSKYNNLASQYRKQLETKYEIPTQSQQPCAFDFTMMNNLLSKQGKR